MISDNNIRKYLKLINSLGLSSSDRIIESSPTTLIVKIKNQSLVNFSSNNYLGVSDDDRVKHAVKKALNIYGLGSGGSRLMTGNSKVQLELEDKIARFKGYPSAITFATGYMANLGVVKSIVRPVKLDFMSSGTRREDGVVFSDSLNHASIVEGVKLAGCEKHVYEHLDSDDLEKKMTLSNLKRKLIITESIYSMDGDIVDLSKIIGVAKKFNSMLMVDDAHGTGVLGISGRGIVEYSECAKEDIDILMGTFTKAFGGFGGFIVGSDQMINYIRYSANSYIFTAPIPPVIASGLIASIDIVINEPERIKKLWDNIYYFKKLLTEANINFLNSTSQIVPIFIGDEKKTVKTARRLLEDGYFTSPVIWPAVKKSEARLRVTITSMHEYSHLESFVYALDKNMKVK